MDTVERKSLNIRANICIHVSPINLTSVRCLSLSSSSSSRSVRSIFFLEQGNIEAAIRKGYIEFDKEMALDEDMREDLAGTTAICVLIKDDKLYCGNVGDSRAIASVNGNVEILSVDHKPNNDDERKRITAAGGWVEFNRVNGLCPLFFSFDRMKIFAFFNV